MQERVAKIQKQSRTLDVPSQNVQQAPLSEILRHGVMQRKLYKDPHNAKELIEKQESLQYNTEPGKIKNELIANTGKSNFTTMGFEHEFAQISNESHILQNVTHVELAESKNVFPFTGLRFTLETDAANAIELVSPPFIIESLKGAPIPNFVDVGKADGYMTTALSNVANNGRTIEGMIRELKTEMGIEFDPNEVEAKICPSNMNTGVNYKELEKSPKTHDRKRTVSKEKILMLEVKKSEKGGGISTQANFETNAETYHLAKVALSPFNTKFTQLFKNIETEIYNAFSRSINGEDSPNLNLFLWEMAKNLSQLLAVPSLIKLNTLKEKLFDLEATENIDIFRFHRLLSSYAKDTDGVWIKDRILSFSRIITGEEIVRAQAICNGAITNIITALNGNFTEGFKEYEQTIITQNLAYMKTTIGTEIDSICTDIGSLQDTKGDSYQAPGFGEHNPQLHGLRQDTFISPDKIKPLPGFEGQALHVIEVRRGSMEKHLRDITIAHFIREGLTAKEIEEKIKDMGYTQNIPIEDLRAKVNTSFNRGNIYEKLHNDFNTYTNNLVTQITRTANLPMWKNQTLIFGEPDNVVQIRNFVASNYDSPVHKLDSIRELMLNLHDKWSRKEITKNYYAILKKIPKDISNFESTKEANKKKINDTLLEINNDLEAFYNSYSR